LNKITLAGSSDGTEKAFYTTGTIDLSKTFSTDLWTISTPAAKQKFDWFSGTQTLATTDYKNPDANYLFVIPQNFSATATDKLYVIVEYTIEGYKDVTTAMKNTVYKRLDKEFEQGKAYTINLNIGLTPIEFNAEVNDWDPKNGESIDASWN
jgi:vesicle coat complex subunit